MALANNTITMILEVQTFPPQLWHVIVAVLGVLVRWLEKKLLSDKAKKVQEKLEDVKSTAQSTTTISKVQEAITANDSLIRSLSPKNFPNNILK